MFRSLQSSQIMTTFSTTFSLKSNRNNLRLVNHHRWTGNLPLPSRPLQPSQLILHPHFSVTPFCEFLNSAQDAQSINKTLSPPPEARAQEATQEPARFPSKAASLVAPRNASRFGNSQDKVGLDGEGGCGKQDNRTRPIMLICWGKTVKNWRATKGNAFHSQG